MSASRLVSNLSLAQIALKALHGYHTGRMRQVAIKFDSKSSLGVVQPVLANSGDFYFSSVFCLFCC